MLSILAAEGPNYRFLPSDIKEFWWSAAAFAIVASLLIWKVLPLARKGLADRSAGIQAEIVEAERAKVEAESELSSLRSKLGDADAEAARITAEAEKTAAGMKAELIAKADADAADARSKADAEVAGSPALTADIQAAVAEQAAEAAESVVKTNLDAGTHADLIDRYIEQVAQS